MKLNKGLEALKHLYNEYILTEYPDSILKDIDKDKEIIEKELKALGIIIKTLEIGKEDLFYDSEDDKYYFFSYEISKEKYDLLKEILNDWVDEVYDRE